MRRNRPLPSADRRAFTLVEILLALAIGALLVTVLVSFLRATRNNSVVVSKEADDALALQLAAELLREELRLTGAHPWPAATVPGIDDVATWLSTPLRIVPHGDGHRLLLRYLDHRLSGPPVARDLTFEVGTDSAGESQLYRRAAGATRQPLVAGVNSLQLVGIVDSEGVWRSWGGAVGAVPRVAALVVELAAGQLVRRLVIELPNRPQLAP